MKIAYKTYAQVDNPENIPPVWPAVVHELKDDDPEPEGFKIVKPKQFERYKAQHQEEYDLWYKNTLEPERKDKQVIRKICANLCNMIEAWQLMESKGEILTAEQRLQIDQYQKYKAMM